MRREAPAAARALLRAAVGATRLENTLHAPMLHDVVILGAVRTPFGGLMGSLSGLTAPELGAAAIAGALAAARMPPGDVDEVVMGCVLQVNRWREAMGQRTDTPDPDPPSPSPPRPALARPLRAKQPYWPAYMQTRRRCRKCVRPG